MSILGDKTAGFMSSDVCNAVINGINFYYQEVFQAKKFKERMDESGKMFYEPCSIKDPLGKNMTSKDFEPHQLFKRKLSFVCLNEIISKSRPSIELQEVNKSKWFEIKHPCVTFSSEDMEMTLHPTKIATLKNKGKSKDKTKNDSKSGLFKKLIHQTEQQKIINAEKSLSLEEIETKTLSYLNQIAEITSDKAFSTLATNFSNLMEKFNTKKPKL